MEFRKKKKTLVVVRKVQTSETWEFDFYLNFEVTYITGRIRMKKNAAS